MALAGQRPQEQAVWQAATKALVLVGLCAVAVVMLDSELVSPAAYMHQATTTGHPIKTAVALVTTGQTFGQGRMQKVRREPRAPIKFVLSKKVTEVTNSATKKRERHQTFTIRQKHMSLYKDPKPYKGSKMKRSTPLYKEYPDNPDMFCMMQHFDLSGLETMHHIVKFEPLISRHKGLTFDGSIVHHMDIFLCSSGTNKRGDPKDHPVITGEFGPMASPGAACNTMPWAYDRDAKALKLPDHVGIAVGKGTPYNSLVIEWHYLLAPGKHPKGGLGMRHHFTDHSGVRFTMTKDLRRHSAATWGLMDMKMSLPSGHRRLHYKYRSKPDTISKVLGHDLKKYGTLKPVAVHLHTHNHGRQVWWDHIRDKKKIGEYGRINHYKGFGRDQSFWIVDAQDSRRGKFSQFKPGKGEALKSGDTVQVNCVYDTRCKYATAKNGAMQNGNCRKTPERIQYGLSHGNEMCGFLMMYYPHDPAHFFPQGSLVTNPQFIQEMPLTFDEDQAVRDENEEAIQVGKTMLHAGRGQLKQPKRTRPSMW